MSKARSVTISKRKNGSVTLKSTGGVDLRNVVPELFFHAHRKNDCSHEWGGWRDFDDGRGGEQVCKKCGLGAMAHTLSLDI